MELGAIIAALETYKTGPFPRDAVEQAIARQDEITPVLLAALEDAKTNIQEIYDKPDYFLHIYAFFLLAQFRETKAYPRIVDFFSIPGEITLDVSGDFVTEDLGRVLASVCDGDLSLIKQLIEDPKVNESVQLGGLSAVLTLVAEDVISRESALEYFQQLFSLGEQEEDSFRLSSLVLDSTELCPSKGLLPLIKTAFENDLIDPMWISLQEVEEVVERGPEAALKDLREKRHYRFVNNTNAEMEWWACFQDDVLKKSRKKPVGLASATGLGEQDTMQKAKRKKKRTMQKQSRKQNRSKKKK